MNQMLIVAGQRALISRDPVPSCHCVRRTTYRTPERDCACCEGTGRFAECEHCCQEVLEGEVYTVECGRHSYVACSGTCAGALVAEALEPYATSDQLSMELGAGAAE